MALDPDQKAKILENSRAHKRDFRVSPSQIRLFAKLTFEDICDMLDSQVIGGAKGPAKKLLEKMVDKTWSITLFAAAPEPGSGELDAEPIMVVNVRVDNGYYLRLHHRSGTLYIVSITGQKPPELS